MSCLVQPCCSQVRVSLQGESTNTLGRNAADTGQLAAACPDAQSSSIRHRTYVLQPMMRNQPLHQAHAGGDATRPTACSPRVSSAAVSEAPSGTNTQRSGSSSVLGMNSPCPDAVPCTDFFLPLMWRTDSPTMLVRSGV